MLLNLSYKQAKEALAEATTQQEQQPTTRYDLISKLRKQLESGLACYQQRKSTSNNQAPKTDDEKRRFRIYQSPQIIKRPSRRDSNGKPTVHQTTTKRRTPPQKSTQSPSQKCSRRYRTAIFSQTFLDISSNLTPPRPEHFKSLKHKTTAGISTRRTHLDVTALNQGVQESVY